jgi:hypothetical protein
LPCCRFLRLALAKESGQILNEMGLKPTFSMTSSMVDFSTVKNSGNLMIAAMISAGWSKSLSHSASPVPETHTTLALQLRDDKLVVADKGVEFWDLKEFEHIDIGASTLETL